MTQFLGDIAGMLEIFAIAFGFVLLHKAKKESDSGYLKTGAWILILGGIIVGVCTLYYWFTFRSHGMFDATMPMNGNYMDGQMGREGGQQE